MKKLLPLLPLLFLLAACSQKQAQTVTLEVLESKNDIALETEEKRLIGKRNPSSLKKIYACESLGVDDIIVLSEVGISDDFILGYLRFTEEIYNLSSNEVRKLERNGVSQIVIRTLMETGD